MPEKIQAINKEKFDTPFEMPQRLTVNQGSYMTRAKGRRRKKEQDQHVEKDRYIYI